MNERTIKMPGFLRRFAMMSQEDRDSEAQAKLDEFSHKIGETEEFCSVSAMTNAWFWDFQVTAEGPAEVEEDEIRVQVSFHVGGDQREDAWFYGDEIEGTGVAIIDDFGKVRFEEVDAEVAGGLI